MTLDENEAPRPSRLPSKQTIKAIGAGGAATSALVLGLGFLAARVGLMSADLGFHARSLSLWDDHQGPLTVLVYSFVAVAAFAALDKRLAARSGSVRIGATWVGGMSVPLLLSVVPAWIDCYRSIGFTEAQEALQRLAADPQGRCLLLASASLGVGLGGALSVGLALRDAKFGPWVVIGGMALSGAIVGGLLAPGFDNTDCQWLRVGGQVEHLGFNRFFMMSGAVCAGALASGLTVLDRVRDRSAPEHGFHRFDTGVLVVVILASLGLVQLAGAAHLRATRAADLRVFRNILPG